MFIVNVRNNDYLCTGSYVVNGEKYQVIGDYVQARKFKSYEAADNWASYLQTVRANVGNYTIIELKAGGKNE